MENKKSNLTRNIFIALVIGITLGFILNKFYVNSQNSKIDFYSKNTTKYNNQIKLFLPDTTTVNYKNYSKSISKFNSEKENILKSIDNSPKDFKNSYSKIISIQDTLKKLDILIKSPRKDTLSKLFTDLKAEKEFSESNLKTITTERDKKLEWFAIIADIFLRLIKMIVAPLVFTTLVVGIAKLGDTKTVGRIGGKTMLWFISASLMSLVLGMILVNLFKPGIAMNLALPLDNQSTGIDKAAVSVKDFVTHVFPKSFIEAMANNEILQIVIFSIFFGISAALNYDTATMRNDLSAAPSNTARALSATSTLSFGAISRLPNQNDERRTNDRNTEQQRVLAVLTYAAAVCMGILDTHPYIDGNGRLARIVVNFILYNHLHLPFPVPLFATPEERVAYTKAICKTRQNIALCPVGDVPDDLLLEAYENCGALQPMVHLILEQICKSVAVCNDQIVEKVSVHSEERDSQAARKVRERALSTDSCPICFGMLPNVSTLCCGTAYHVQCLAQCLKINGKCPVCRYEMPCLEEKSKLSRDLRRITDFFTGIIPSDFHEFSDDTLGTGLMNILESEEENNINNRAENGDENDTEDSSENDTEENDDENDTELNDTVTANVPPECQYCNNISAFECSNHSCGPCCRIVGGEYCTRHST